MKKWVVRTVIILLAVLLFIGIIPFEKEVSYCATDYEFALDRDGAVASHEVRIEGKYYTSFLLKDRFWGTFYVSDVEGLTEDMRVNFTFEPNRWHHAYFLDYAGQPHSTEIVKIYFDRNFTTVALQFATKFEREGDMLSVAADNEKSNFLVIGAENKEEALTEYTRMLKEKQPKSLWRVIF